MGQIVPDAVERYLSTLNRLGDPVLEEVARAGETAQLPLVDAEVGGLLRLLATSIGANRILEIGTAIGYSGIWLAGALPAGGMLLTIERDPDRARLAREHFARAGLANRVSILVGDAQRMLAKVAGPFDLIFQDGDKTFYEPALESAGGASSPRRAAGHRQCAVGRRGGAGIRRPAPAGPRGHAGDRCLQ